MGRAFRQAARDALGRSTFTTATRSSPRSEAQSWNWFYENAVASRRAAGEEVTLEQVHRQYEARQEPNILTPVHQQVACLTEIGYADADCLVKAQEMAVFGGYKPADAVTMADG